MNSKELFDNIKCNIDDNIDDNIDADCQIFLYVFQQDSHYNGS